MSNYTKTTNFATKDNLSPGNPLKIVKGTEIDTEYNNIATAVATKTDGAASSTDNAIARFDSTTGKIIQNSAVTIDDTTGDITGTATQGVFNTVSTTVNAFGAATAVNIGAATGTATVNNTTLAAKAITASATLAVTGASTLTGAVTASSTLAVTGVATLGNGAVLGTPTSATLTNATGLPISTGVSGLGSNVATFLATPSSANLISAVTDETGTGALVFATSPTLVTPLLGTPTSATLTNATGLPISTGVSGLGTGVATLLATPSSANLASAITDETGSGALVFATSPTLVTPILGTPTSGTLTNATGLPISTGVSGLGTGVATFLATPSSANLISAVTDETGTGSLVFATSPTLVTPALGTPSSGVATNLTGLPLTTGVTGLLPVANGGTATATPSIVAGTNITVTGTWPNQTIAASGGSTSPGGSTTQVQYNNAGAFGGITGATTNGTALTLVAPVLGTPASATLTNATGLPISTGVSGLGTGVATALAVNVGSAGAPIVNGGVLGTPSSGTVTNLTGTASININGTVGATTATTGAFTTLSATGVTTLQAGTAALPALTTSGDTNTGIFFPAADTIAFSEGGAEAMRIDASGLLGIGTTSPSSFSTFPSRIVLGSGAGQESITIYSGTASEGNLIFADGTAGTAQYMGLVRYDHADNGLKFYTNGGTLRTTINSSGGLKTQNTIGVGDATPSTSGAGITFPATQSASTDANTLDDYEEGTWTPSMGGTTTYTQQTGIYTKVGNLVTVSFQLKILLIGTGSQFSVTGLPFTQSSTGSLSCSGSCGYFETLAASVVSVNVRTDAGQAYVIMSSLTAAATQVANNAIIGNNTYIVGTVSYRVA